MDPAPRATTPLLGSEQGGSWNPGCKRCGQTKKHGWGLRRLMLPTRLRCLHNGAHPCACRKTQRAPEGWIPEAFHCTEKGEQKDSGVHVARPGAHLKAGFPKPSDAQKRENRRITKLRKTAMQSPEFRNPALPSKLNGFHGSHGTGYDLKDLLWSMFKTIISIANKGIQIMQLSGGSQRSPVTLIITTSLRLGPRSSPPTFRGLLIFKSWAC